MSKELKKEERNKVSGGVNGKINVKHKDIEHMDILKDAASAAIYGSRAANSNEVARPKGIFGVAIMFVARFLDKKH